MIGAESIPWWEGTIGFNVLQLKSGVIAEEVRLTRIGDGLVLLLDGTGD